MRFLDVKSEHGFDVGREVGEEDDCGEGVANVRCDQGDQGDRGEEGAPRHGQFLGTLVHIQCSMDPWGRLTQSHKIIFKLNLFITIVSVVYAIQSQKIWLVRGLVKFVPAVV